MHITLTSKMGSFIFDRDVILSRAKLIRDSVTGEFFAPKSRKKIKTAEDAQVFAQSLPSALTDIPFEVVINPVKE